MNQKNFKILLIYPPSILAPGFARKAVLPLGIAYLAAVLRNKGMQVEVVDCILEGFDTTFTFNGSDYYGLRLEEIRERISQGKYDIVGVSCQFSSMLEIVLEICRISKDCGVKHVIVGGPHASAQPESLLLSKSVDYVFIGEAEKSIVDFVNYLREGNTHHISNINGLAYMENGYLHRTSSLSFIENIDSIPFPARDLFPIEKYFTKCSPMGGIFKSRRNLSIITSRGCPGRCNFCASARFWGTRFRARSPENVFAEIEELRDKYGVEEIQFQDDNFTLNKERALEICRGMKERIKLPWSVPSGLALWALDKEIINAMSDAGCHYAAVAIESGNQRVLSEIIKKPLKLDRVPELCRHFKKRKIKLAAFFITGFPGETLEEIKDTFNFASKCNLDNANFYFLTPLPGSQLWDQAVKENLFVKDFSLKNAIYDRPSLTSKDWTLKELVDAVQRQKRVFYLKTLLRRPRVLLFRIFEMIKNNPKHLLSMIYSQLFSQLFSRKIILKGQQKIEERKKKEKEFHDRQRTVTEDIHVADMRWSPELEPTIKNNPLWANMKYYSIERKSRSVVLEWLRKNCQSKRILDYCCGNGEDVIFVAQNGALDVVGIDISEISIKNCKEKVDRLGFKNATFRVMDAEALDFANETFDVVTEYGSLHHLDLNKAYSEIARVLKFNGRAICVETLGHNEIIRLYRKLTPHLRTEWETEHILRKRDIELARKYFGNIEIIGFFHLFTLLAVPFRNLPVFNFILGVLEKIDSILLKLPFLKWWGWHIVFILSSPKK